MSKSSTILYSKLLLSNLFKKHNCRETLNYFTIKSNLEKMICDITNYDDDDDGGIQNPKLNYCYCYSLLDSVLGHFTTN